MPGACGWKRPFKTVKAAASPVRPAGLRIVLTWIACSWRCFWRSGGPRIWQQPVFIMGNAIALIAWTDATRASFGWDDSGSWIFCVEHAIERLYAGVYPFSTPKRVGALPCVSNTQDAGGDRKSTRLNSSHVKISYA